MPIGRAEAAKNGAENVCPRLYVSFSNMEKAVPELAIALLTIYDVAATSCVALEDIKGAMQEAGHAYSATKHGVSAEHGASYAEKTDHPGASTPASRVAARWIVVSP